LPIALLTSTSCLPKGALFQPPFTSCLKGGERKKRKGGDLGFLVFPARCCNYCTFQFSPAWFQGHGEKRRRGGGGSMVACIQRDLFQGWVYFWRKRRRERKKDLNETKGNIFFLFSRFLSKRMYIAQRGGGGGKRGEKGKGA